MFVLRIKPLYFSQFITLFAMTIAVGNAAYNPNLYAPGASSNQQIATPSDQLQTLETGAESS